MNRFLTLILLGVPTLVAKGDSTFETPNEYTYGANIGWVNAQGDNTNGVAIGQAFCSGYAYSANCGWISFGDGTPVDGMAYANNAANDFGVNHDGSGNLTGYAYGANIGWIAFEQTYGMPKVDLTTGALSGYAWGANVGWISLDGLVTTTVDPGPDTDSDGIPDWWEIANGGTGNFKALGDWDQDGVSDPDEYMADTDPDDDTDYLQITFFEFSTVDHQINWMVNSTRLYTLAYTDDLTAVPVVWTSVRTFVPSSDGLNKEIIDDVADTFRIYRVTAVPPLHP